MALTLAENRVRCGHVLLFRAWTNRAARNARKSQSAFAARVRSSPVAWKIVWLKLVRHTHEKGSLALPPLSAKAL
eukprot:7086596-Prymnesium_polylepis.1